jgi:hypothetical protein
MSILLITATTDPVPASSDTEFQIEANGRPRVLSASNLQPGETVTLEYQGLDGQWGTAQISSGDVVLTSALKQVLVVGPGRYRVSKTLTDNPCAVGVSS